MSSRSMRRFVRRLLRGKPTQRIRPDDFETRQIEAAIELRAARTGSDAPSEEFVADLHRRLANELTESQAPTTFAAPIPRRQIVIAGSAAAASAAAGMVVGRTLLGPEPASAPSASPDTVVDPEDGEWRAVAPSSELPAGGALAFDLGSVSGFVHRAADGLQAVSAICTHQGCKLRLDEPDQKLTCPCHRTSFSLAGRTLNHQLPAAPPPLPRFRAREANGVIEVFAPAELA